MNRRLLLALLLSIGLINAFPQTQKTETPTVIEDENQKLIVNKNLGIYLWLSTSPDENSTKHRLMSDSSARYSNPMYLDTEGYNTVRSPSAVDTLTKSTIYPEQDIIFEVYSDGLAPVSKISFSKDKSIYYDNKLFMRGNVIAKINSSDAVSGVKDTYISLNGKEFQKYNQEVKISTEGKTQVKYYSCDKVGNVENVKEKTIYIDNTPPVTEYEIIGEINDNFVSPDAKIKLSSSDSLSGVKTIYYKLNNGSPKVYTAPVSVKYLTDQGSFAFYAIDQIGNKETLRSIGGKNSASATNNTGGNNDGLLYEFYVDKDPPTIELIEEGDLFKGKYRFISERTLLKINTEDAKSGVNKVLYSIDSKTIDQIYNKPFTLNGPGLKYIRAYAEDYVGNKSSVVYRSYFCDTEAPTSTLSFSNPKHQGKDTLFISSKTKISIHSSDKVSGTAQKLYSLNSKPEIEYTTSFSIESEGMTTLAYYAKDKVLNIETKNESFLYVDNNPPDIFHHFSSTAIGEKTVREKQNTIYPSNVQLYIAATDKESGGEKIEYKINDGPTLSTNPIKNLSQGNYIVSITAYDVLGNKSSKDVHFAVED